MDVIPAHLGILDDVEVGILHRLWWLYYAQEPMGRKS